MYCESCYEITFFFEITYGRKPQQIKTTTKKSKVRCTPLPKWLNTLASRQRTHAWFRTNYKQLQRTGFVTKSVHVEFVVKSLCGFIDPFLFIPSLIVCVIVHVTEALLYLSILPLTDTCPGYVNKPSDNTAVHTVQ